MEDNKLINIEDVYKDIKYKIITARERMLKHIDTTMVEVYWYVGKITSELLNNNESNYGKQIVDSLSNKLTAEFGNGFSPVSIRRMRRFYEFYPIWSTVSTELSWAHFQELIKIDRKEEREFYCNEIIASNWGVRELRRQLNTKLYDRYLISPDKKEIMKLSANNKLEKNSRRIA